MKEDQIEELSWLNFPLDIPLFDFSRRPCFPYFFKPFFGRFSFLCSLLLSCLWCTSPPVFSFLLLLFPPPVSLILSAVVSIEIRPMDPLLVSIGLKVGLGGHWGSWAQGPPLGLCISLRGKKGSLLPTRAKRRLVSASVRCELNNGSWCNDVIICFVDTAAIFNLCHSCVSSDPFYLSPVL